MPHKKSVLSFQQLDLVQLETMTGIDQTRWSRYLSGKVAMTSRTLEKAAKRLGMQPQDLLQAIRMRIQARSKEKLSTYTR